jgi:tetratricopeptide (TPR) repeat protein
MIDAALRYRAFLSYSHRDGVATQRLHRRLETYPVPRALRGIQADGRDVPARIHPVFRDRDELASATQLSRTIEEALDASEALVVVCSPAAVASPWVNAEIAYFRRHHPDRLVLAFVVAGDPGLDPRKTPDRAAFPLSLLVDPDQPDAALGEPIAADAREEGDGFSAAFLKLAAGLLGVRYDQLRRRDQRRRQLRWSLASASALVLAAVFAFLAWQATVARDQARAAQSMAELELQSERQTREFLLSVFSLSDASEARGSQVTVREVLDRAVDRIDRQEFSRPEIRSRYLATMGQAYSSLGLNRRSVELLRHSLAALGQGEASPEMQVQQVESRIELADSLYDMGEYEAALKEADPAALTLTPLQAARMASIRGDVLTYLERDADAQAAYEQALALVQRSDPKATAATLVRARSLSGMAQIALFSGHPDKAVENLTASVALLTAAVGVDHPHTISATGSLGSAAYGNGDRGVAREMWGRALSNAQRVYDADNPHIGTLKNNLGLLLLEEGDLAAAEPLLRDALASDRKHRSDTFDDLAYPLHNLGYLMLVQGRMDEARPLLEEGVTVAQASHHRMLGPLLSALGDLRCAQGQATEGIELAQRAIAVYEMDAEAAAWRAAQARLTLGYCRARAGEAIERRTLRSDADVIVAIWKAASPFVRRAREQLAALRG